MNKYSDVSIGEEVTNPSSWLPAGNFVGVIPFVARAKQLRRTVPGMGNKMIGLSARESKREIRKQRLHVLAYVGLGILALATVVVVVIALRR